MEEGERVRKYDFEHTWLHISHSNKKQIVAKMHIDQSTIAILFMLIRPHLQGHTGTRGSWSSPVPDTRRRSGGVNRSERDARCLALWRVHLVAQKHRQKPSIFFSGKHG